MLFIADYLEEMQLDSSSHKYHQYRYKKLKGAERNWKSLTLAAHIT